MSERVRHGIQYVEIDQLSSELRIVGSDDPGLFLWAAQWLDEHRGFVVHAARFEWAPGPDDDTDLTATLVISMNHAGESPDGREPGQLGPWPHGVPPIPITFGRGPAPLTDRNLAATLAWRCATTAATRTELHDPNPAD